MKLLRTILLLLSGLALASAAPAAAPAPPVSVSSEGLAAGGYDVTAYFTAGRPERGLARHEMRYMGATWRFASAAARARFAASPAAFAPQFGGYCAWAVSQGYLAPGDPRHWRIVAGKLYLNFNARAKALWEADRAAAIARGHANWPRVLSDNQDS